MKPGAITINVMVVIAAAKADIAARTAVRVISRASHAMKVASHRTAVSIVATHRAKASTAASVVDVVVAAEVAIVARAAVAAIKGRVPRASKAAAQFERSVNKKPDSR
jgi:hypothetical protein